MIKNKKLAHALESDIDFQAKLNVYNSMSPNWPLAFFIAEEIRNKIDGSDAIIDLKSLARILNDRGLAELSLIYAGISKREMNGVIVWAAENAGPTSHKLTFESDFLIKLLDDLKQI